jgi:hypothetical protein
MIKTSILAIIMAGAPDRAYYTQACDEHIRILSEQMPSADLFCITPDFSLRPVARGDTTK